MVKKGAGKLELQKIKVCHITSKTGCRAHKRTRWARVRKGKIMYPAEKKTKIRD